MLIFLFAFLRKQGSVPTAHSRRTIMKIEKGDTSVTFANVLVLMDILGLSLRLIDLNLFVRPHNQITYQDENNVINNEDGWYE
ncbi:hypothetical protein [Vibrio sp. SG41-7]|uniref:hypothetical protein n=1 Tax=Vibrio sp. SG41-7 TaxID=2760973 RepID=UPI002175EC60|nr:hypothetical protein [Vibrio sp. SG41-7]